MKSYWKERQSVVEELNRKVTFLWSYGQTTVVISGNNGSAPLIGSEDNQDRASDGSVSSEKEPRIHGPMRPNARCEDCEEENRLSLCDICVKLWNRFIWLFVTAQQQLSIPEEVCSEDDIAYHSQSHTSANHIPQPITYLSQTHTCCRWRLMKCRFRRWSACCSGSHTIHRSPCHTGSHDRDTDTCKGHSPSYTSAQLGVSMDQGQCNSGAAWLWVMDPG